MAPATADAVRGVSAATADAVRPFAGVAVSGAGAVVFADGTGAVAALAGVAVVLLTVAFLLATAAGCFVAAGAGFFAAAVVAGLLAAPDAVLAGAFAATFPAADVATLAAGADAGDLVTDFFAATFVGVFAAAPVGVLVAFAPVPTVLVVFTSPDPPFLAAPLAAAELLAFFAISFTSVAVAAGCYSPDALPQQPLFWDTVDWLTPVDTGLTVTRLLLFLLSIYKRWLSPLLGARCRFHPSCSDYARVAIARFGPWRGTVLGTWRVLRCQPLCEGGHDPVPEHFVLRRCGAQGAHTHD